MLHGVVSESSRLYISTGEAGVRRLIYAGVAHRKQGSGISQHILANLLAIPTGSVAEHLLIAKSVILLILLSALNR